MGQLNQLPPEAWDSYDYTHIHAVVLFADLENSVMISSALSPEEYDRLVNSFQRAMLGLVEMLKGQDSPIGEFSAVGDQLTVFFYDPLEVWRNFRLDGPAPLDGAERTQLILECRKANERMVFSAIKAAIQLKNLWLIQPFSVDRVRLHRAPLNLGIGIHMGQVFLCNRADGRLRIEGNTVNIGKRIESFARMGHYSQTMFSQRTRDAVRSSVIGHSQLRQRIFFHHHTPSLELMKGVAQQQHAFELKFYHRLGVKVPEGAFEQYHQIFGKDRTNIWAYYQLFDHHAFQLGDWRTAFELSKMAEIVHPEDEKVSLDLSKCYYNFSQYEQARRHAVRSLELNPEFDLVYEHLAEIAKAVGDVDAEVQHSRSALMLSPNSPLNNLNLGVALTKSGNRREGALFLEEALRLYPDFTQHSLFKEAMEELRAAGASPP